MSKDCWAKGGGKEGQGPKGRKGPNRGNRSNQAQEANSDLNEASYMAFNTREINKFDWIFDTGSTSHICTQRDAFIDYYPLTNSTITGIGPTPASALGKGTVMVHMSVNGQTIPHRLRDVLHVPSAPNCLLSAARFDDAGGKFEGGDGRCFLKNKTSNIIAEGTRIGRLYLLNGRAQLLGQERTNYAAVPKLPWDQWHRRYGHISISALERLDRENMVDGLKIDQSSIASKSCDACIQAKQARRSYPQEAEHRSQTPGERVMSDVWGPAGKESIGRWKYYISFTDDCTRYVHVLFLKDKGQAFDRIKKRIAQIKRHFGKVPKWLRFDNGKELVNDKLKKLAMDEGIIIETSAPYSPSQNGVAERFNRTLLELARAMLISKNLPTFLWDEAVAHAAYLRNRAPTRALNGKTPYEAWHGAKPNVSHLRVFGSDVWVLDESKNRSKLDPKSKKMTLVGFMDGSKSVRYYDAASQLIKVSRNVAFNENDEPRELEDFVKIPGLQAEGEDCPEETPLQTESESQPIVAKIIPKDHTTNPENISRPKEIPELPKLQSRMNTIDYRKLDNPKSRLPSLRATSQSPIPSLDISGPTEASKAKNKSQEQANFALERLYKKILDNIEYSFSASNTDDPKTVEEALSGVTWHVCETLRNAPARLRAD